jgi:hypothetical protein
MGREAAAAHDRHVRHVPPALDAHGRARREGPGEPPLRAPDPLPPRRRARARQRPRRLRPALAAALRPQPAGYWAYLNFPPREWDASPGEDQYRRGLYTWWQRSFPQPSLAAFDAPSREECTGERVRSNVPQQALVLLNDPAYVEAARVFAERILRDGGPSVASRLRFAYARALSRAPSQAEERVLADLLRSSRSSFARDPAAARRLVATGQFSTARLPPVELAAWTQVARAILNLPELVTRF